MVRTCWGNRCPYQTAAPNALVYCAISAGYRTEGGSKSRSVQRNLAPGETAACRIRCERTVCEMHGFSPRCALLARVALPGSGCSGSENKNRWSGHCSARRGSCIWGPGSQRAFHVCQGPGSTAAHPPGDGASTQHTDRCSFAHTICDEILEARQGRGCPGAMADRPVLPACHI